MQLNPVASTIIVISYVIGSLLLIALLGVLVYVLLQVNAKLELFQSKVDPLIAKVDGLLILTTEKVDSIGGKTEAILSEGEAAAEAVHERVERTAAVVQQTVSKPIVGVNAVVAGVARGAATFAALQSRNSKETSNGVKGTGIAVAIRNNVGNPSDGALVDLSGSTADLEIGVVEIPVIVAISAPSAFIATAPAGSKE